jgi:hypothetical protein
MLFHIVSHMVNGHGRYLDGFRKEQTQENNVIRRNSNRSVLDAITARSVSGLSSHLQNMGCQMAKPERHSRA